MRLLGKIIRMVICNVKTVLISFLVFISFLTLFSLLSITVSMKNAILDLAKTGWSGDLFVQGKKEEICNLKDRVMDKYGNITPVMYIQIPAFCHSLEKPVMLRIVSDDYFDKSRTRVFNFKNITSDYPYVIFSNQENKGQIKRHSFSFLQSDPASRPSIFKSKGSFTTGLKSLDENFCFLVTADIFDYNLDDEEVWRIQFEFSKDCPVSPQELYYFCQNINPNLQYGDFNSAPIASLSALSSSYATVYILSVFFVLLCSLYAIMASGSSVRRLKKEIQIMNIFGSRKIVLSLYMAISVLVFFAFSSFLGTIFGTFFSKVLIVFLKKISNIFGLSLGFYFLDMPLVVPFKEFLILIPTFVLTSFLMALIASYVKIKNVEK